MWRAMRNAALGVRTAGRPTSSNGASSFHLHWADVPAALEASVELEVIESPTVPALYFWALQASFGPDGGGAHLGLQWNPRHGGSTAVNWGGYERGGRILEGTPSGIASTVDDPNTRTWGWSAHRRYRLRIHRGSTPGWWSGEVADLETGAATHVRQLAGGGRYLERLMVWSEVFADCDAPSVAARWSRPSVLARDGGRSTPTGYRVAYQAYEKGGCTNTDASPAGEGVVQRTSTARTTPPGAIVPLARGTE